MILGEALEYIKAGCRVKRKYWRYKSVFMRDTKDSHYYLMQAVRNREPTPYHLTNNDIFADDWEMSNEG